MIQTTTIHIPSGTIVSAYSNTPKGVAHRFVTLQCDAVVEATRHDDGSYGYCVNGNAYAASAGTVFVL